jgi:hypothetical protein
MEKGKEVRFKMSASKNFLTFKAVLFFSGKNADRKQFVHTKNFMPITFSICTNIANIFYHFQK